jgi:hypothetical protein
MPDNITEMMQQGGVPVTRENYIELNWGKPLPMWDAELEAQLPEELQDWSLFEIRNGNLELKKK